MMTSHIYFVKYKYRNFVIKPQYSITSRSFLFKRVFLFYYKIDIDIGKNITYNGFCIPNNTKYDIKTEKTKILEIK